MPPRAPRYDLGALQAEVARVLSVESEERHRRGAQPIGAFIAFINGQPGGGAFDFNRVMNRALAFVVAAPVLFIVGRASATPAE
jgi:hypothetical protein